jgi:hypothetical protein
LGETAGTHSIGESKIGKPETAERGSKNTKATHPMN